MFPPPPMVSFSRHAARKSPKQQVAGRIVNSRIGKTGVNPLTRPSSRSVMRGNYSSLLVEGLAATLDSLLNRFTGHRAI